MLLLRLGDPQYQLTFEGAYVQNGTTEKDTNGKEFQTLDELFAFLSEGTYEISRRGQKYTATINPDVAYGIMLTTSSAAKTDTVSKKVVIAAGGDRERSVNNADAYLINNSAGVTIYALDTTYNPAHSLTFSNGLEVKPDAALTLGNSTARRGTTIRYTFCGAVDVDGNLVFDGNAAELGQEGGTGGSVTFSSGAGLTVNQGGRVKVGSVAVVADGETAANPLFTVRQGGELDFTSNGVTSYSTINTSGTAIKVDGGNVTIDAGRISTSGSEPAVVVDSGAVTISKFQGGNVSAPEITSGSSLSIKVAEDATLTLEDGQVTSSGVKAPAIQVEKGGTVEIPVDSKATVTSSNNENKAIDLADGSTVKKGEVVTVIVSDENGTDNYVDNYGNIILAKGAKAGEGADDTLNAAVILKDGTIIQGTEESAPTITTDDNGKTTVSVPVGGKVDDETLTFGGSVTTDESTGTTVVSQPVAKIGEKTYNTLDEAIAAAQVAQDPADKIVTLIADVKLDEVCDLNNDLTIDLNEHKITGNNVRAFHIKKGTLTLTGTGTVTTVAAEQEAISSSSSVIRVGDGAGWDQPASSAKKAGLVIDSDVIIEAPATYGVTAFGSDTDETVTIRGKIYATGTAAALSGNGMDKTTGTNITIEDGAEVTAEGDAAIYHPQAGTLNVKGGNIRGKTGIEMKAGTLNVINSPVIGSTESTVTNTPNNDGTSTTGYAVAIVENNAYAGKPAANLGGGTYSGEVAIVKDSEYVSAENAGKISITGGTYPGQENIKDYVAPGYTVNSGGTVVKSSSSSGGSGGGTPTYAVSAPSKVENGSVKISPKSAKENSTVTITVTPDEGYELSSLNAADSKGNAVKLNDNGDGTYTFRMPASKVEVSAVFKKIETVHDCPSKNFTDVDTTQWYHESIDYVVEKGMMNGVSSTSFAPDADTTRGMIVTILYRLEGSPAAASAVSFDDVAADEYYADAVAWASANGIVTGYDSSRFGPNDQITREQLAAILYRYAGFKKYDVSKTSDLSAYTDSASVSDYAADALEWANAEGLVNGMGDGRIAPQGSAVRAQAATILMRFCENIAK